MAGRRGRGSVLGAYAVAAALLAGGTIPEAAAAERPAPSPVHAVDVEALAGDEPLRNVLVAPVGGGCGPASETPVTDDADISVTLAPAPAFTVGAVPAGSWRRTPVTDPAWQLAFRGFMWMPALAQRAAADHQQGALSKIVAQALAFYTDDPDPGTSTAGWDEGTSMRRLTALNCLYQLTADDRLVPAMAAEVAVLTGRRYYGPPYHKVHNHGLMANLAVLRAGRLLGRNAWISTALARMSTEVPLAFSRLGTTFEQSSAYQLVNVSLWQQAARAIEAAAPGSPVLPVIRGLVDRAAAVGAWLTEPDGNIVLIGDADEQAGVTRPGATAHSFRDDAAGLGVGRWSWSDPATTYYTVRYGPPMRAHGQEDRGGVTWSPRGVRVLVNSGRYTYDTTSHFLPYQDGPAGHNVAVPRGGKVQPRAWVTVTKTALAAAAHQWWLQDRLFGSTHKRAVLVAPSKGTLTVSDSFPGRTSLGQQWHLDPAWRLAGLDARARRARFTRADGKVLTVVSTGRLSVLRGSTRPIGGWYFPTYGSRLPNVQLTSSGTGSVRTVFRLH